MFTSPGKTWRAPIIHLLVTLKSCRRGWLMQTCKVPEHWNTASTHTKQVHLTKGRRLTDSRWLRKFLINDELTKQRLQWPHTTGKTDFTDLVQNVTEQTATATNPEERGNLISQIATLYYLKYLISTKICDTERIRRVWLIRRKKAVHKNCPLGVSHVILTTQRF